MSSQYRDEEVRVSVEEYEGSYVVAYVREAGAIIQTLYVDSEEEADRMLHEYETKGTLTINNNFHPYVEVIQPTLVFKAEVIKMLMRSMRIVEVQET